MLTSMVFDAVPVKGRESECEGDGVGGGVMVAVLLTRCRDAVGGGVIVRDWVTVAVTVGVVVGDGDGMYEADWINVLLSPTVRVNVA